MKTFTTRIHVYVQVKMSLIYVLNAVSTIRLSIVSRVVEQFVVHGLNGHHGLHVQKHVVVGIGHVREPLHGTMQPRSLKYKAKTAIQVIFRYRSTEITRKTDLSKNGIICHTLWSPNWKTKKNNLETCPHWGAWKPWGACSAPCYEDGKPKPTQDRYRCWTINGVEDCGNGSGHEYFDYAQRPCNTDNKCAAVCVWSEWGQWSACNPDCKQGIRLKRRTNNEESEGKVQFLKNIRCNIMSILNECLRNEKWTMKRGGLYWCKRRFWRMWR